MRNLKWVLLLTLLFSAGLAQAKQYSCEIKNLYLARDANGREIKGLDLDGTQLCTDDVDLKAFVRRNGTTGHDHFREIKLANGQSVWVAEKGIQLSERIVPMPMPRPAHLTTQQRVIPYPADRIVRPGEQIPLSNETPAQEPSNLSRFDRENPSPFDQVIPLESTNPAPGVIAVTTPEHLPETAEPVKVDVSAMSADIFNDPTLAERVEDLRQQEANTTNTVAVVEPTVAAEEIETGLSIKAETSGYDIPFETQDELVGSFGPGANIEPLFEENGKPVVFNGYTNKETGEWVHLSPEDQFARVRADGKEVWIKISDLDGFENLSAPAQTSAPVQTLVTTETTVNTETPASVDTPAVVQNQNPVDTTGLLGQRLEGDFTAPQLTAEEYSPNAEAAATEFTPLETEDAIDPNIPRPLPTPANLPALRANFAKNKTDQFFQDLPENNWGKTGVNLNLRNNPGVNGTQVMAVLQSNARVVVIDSKEVEGRRWHKVIPFDCSSVSLKEGGDPAMQAEDPCNQSYWVAGSNIEQVTPATVAEIQNRPAPQEFTEGGICQNCQSSEIAGFENESGVIDLGEEIQAAVEENNASLFEEYLEFQKDFMARHPKAKNKSISQWARENKALFIDEMIEKMGIEKANDAVLALTAFGEARGAGAKRGVWDNMAEMATVITVINNRAQTGYRSNTNLVNDNSPASAQMRAALADSQFSAWNTNDNNLGTMMISGLSGVRNRGDLSALSRAFETLNMMEKREIVPLGNLAEGTTRHYHTPGLFADLGSWWRNQRPIASPMVRTPGGDIAIKSHSVYQGIR